MCFLLGCNCETFFRKGLVLIILWVDLALFVPMYWGGLYFRASQCVNSCVPMCWSHSCYCVLFMPLYSSSGSD